jgi:hypothetical protein
MMMPCVVNPREEVEQDSPIEIHVSDGTGGGQGNPTGG